MKFWKLIGIGSLVEITEGEYKFAMEMCVRESFQEIVTKPMAGFNYKGIAYLCLPA